MRTLSPLTPEIERLSALFLDGIRLHPFAQRGDAFNRRLAPCADKLNVGVDQLKRGLEVAAIERVKESPKGSDHLLVSHRPRSISRSHLESAGRRPRFTLATTG